MNRRVCILLLLGGLVYAQGVATTPSLAANEAGGAGLQPTVKSDTGSVSDLPPLPPSKATVLGGTIRVLDHLRDRMILQIHGGGRTVVFFDERTRVCRDGQAASLDELKNGDRVYVDTVLDGTRIFARNISLATSGAIGRTDGQVVSFEPSSGELTLRDTISLVPWKMRLTPETVILRGDRPASPAELRRGTLVAAAFLPRSDGRVVVRQISILASPGAAFIFSGRLVHVDLHRGLLVLMDPRDQKSYVYFNPTVRALSHDIREGADVTVSATFDGNHYAAQSITLNSVSNQ